MCYGDVCARNDEALRCSCVTVAAPVGLSIERRARSRGDRRRVVTWGFQRRAPRCEWEGFEGDEACFSACVLASSSRGSDDGNVQLKLADACFTTLARQGQGGGGRTGVGCRG